MNRLKNITQFFIIAMTVIFSVTLQGRAQVGPASQGVPVAQDSVIENDSTPANDDQSIKTRHTSDSVSAKVREKAKSGITNTKETSRKEVSNKKESIKSNTNTMLEGDGITNENAEEKIGAWMQNARSTDGLQKGTDQLGKGALPDGKDLTTTEVFSDKKIKFAYDSLLTKVDWNVVNAMLRDPASVNQGSILEAVFVKFPGLKRISDTKQDAMLLQGMVAGVDPTRTLSALAAVHLHDLRRLDVSDSALSQLPPLRGGKMDAKYAQYAEKYRMKMDSLRKINLKGAGLSLKEKRLDSLSKESRIRKHTGFFQKIYFEGIVGLLNGGWNGSINLIQLSPSLGYHIHKNVSVGLGPSVVLQTQQKKLNAVMGTRSFLKYELLRYNVYLQVEDNLMFPHVDKSTVETKHVDTQHALFTGGGYLLPISKRIALNASVLYRITGDSSMPGLSGGSPWIYRIGISSNKASSGKK